MAHIESGKEDKQKLKWRRTTENIKMKLDGYSNRDIIRI